MLTDQVWGLKSQRALKGASPESRQGQTDNCCWGRLWRDFVRRKVKKLGSGDVSGKPVGQPVEVLDRQLDPEMWDSHQGYSSESPRNTDL